MTTRNDKEDDEDDSGDGGCLLAFILIVVVIFLVVTDACSRIVTRLDCYAGRTAACVHIDKSYEKDSK